MSTNKSSKGNSTKDKSARHATETGNSAVDEQLIDSAVQAGADDEDGGHRERRKIYMICAAVHNGNLILEPVEAETTDAAGESFRAKHGCMPQKVLSGDPKINAGWAMVKTVGRNEATAVTVSTLALKRLTGDMFMGEFKGWKVIGSGLKATSVTRKTPNGGEKTFSYADNELLNIDVLGEVDPKTKGTLHRPKLKKHECVLRTNISGLRSLSEDELSKLEV